MNHDFLYRTGPHSSGWHTGEALQRHLRDEHHIEFDGQPSLGHLKRVHDVLVDNRFASCQPLNASAA